VTGTLSPDLAATITRAARPVAATAAARPTATEEGLGAFATAVPRHPQEPSGSAVAAAAKPQLPSDSRDVRAGANAIVEPITRSGEGVQELTYMPESGEIRMEGDLLEWLFSIRSLCPPPALYPWCG
jgi:hypothetical protein